MGVSHFQRHVIIGVLLKVLEVKYQQITKLVTIQLKEDMMVCTKFNGIHVINAEKKSDYITCMDQENMQPLCEKLKRVKLKNNQ